MASKPADWFTADNYPLLEGYCRHIVTSDFVAARIDKAERDPACDMEAYSGLLALRERETRAISALARAMRLTQQSKYDHKTANTASKGGGLGMRPWDFRG